MPTDLTDYKHPSSLTNLIEYIRKGVSPTTISELFSLQRAVLDDRSAKMFPLEAEFILFYKLIVLKKTDLFKQLVKNNDIVLSDYNEFTHDPGNVFAHYYIGENVKAFARPKTFHLLELAIILLPKGSTFDSFIRYLLLAGLKPNYGKQREVKYYINYHHGDTQYLIDLYNAIEKSSIAYYKGRPSWNAEISKVWESNGMIVQECLIEYVARMADEFAAYCVIETISNEMDINLLVPLFQLIKSTMKNAPISQEDKAKQIRELYRKMDAIISVEVEAIADLSLRAAITGFKEKIMEHTSASEFKEGQQPKNISARKAFGFYTTPQPNYEETLTPESSALVLRP